jgi:hypothetical protein
VILDRPPNDPLPPQGGSLHQLLTGELKASPLTLRVNVGGCVKAGDTPFTYAGGGSGSTMEFGGISGCCP